MIACILLLFIVGFIWFPKMVGHSAGQVVLGYRRSVAGYEKQQRKR